MASGCACGQHASQAEHDSRRIVGCSSVARRGIGGRACALSARPDSPRLPARGRRIDRAGRHLAVLSARHGHGGCSPKAATPEKKDLKVGFIPITCATPIIMAHPMGFYTKHGLNVEVVKTAGWAVIRDKTLNKEYDAAHMLSPMPLAITLGVGSNADPLHHAGGREHQRPGHHARRSSTRTSAIRSSGKASSSPCRSTTRCTTTCCATSWPSTASIPTATSRSARCRRRRWSPTCAPTTSTASSRPIR